MDFRWTEWTHVARHGVEPEAAEEAVLGASRGFPRRIGDEKWLVWGADGSVFVVHARPLTDAEKGRYRRRRR